MNFEPLPDLTILFVVFLAAFALAFVVGFAIDRYTGSKLAATIVMVVGVVGALTGLVVVGANAPSRADMLQAAAADEYNLDLSTTQAGELGYPVEMPAPGVEQAYGLTTVLLGDAWQQISLVWTGEELNLVTVGEAGAVGQELGVGKVSGKTAPTG